MSKWILITVENNDIIEPTTHDTYKQAYQAMEREFTRLRDAQDDASICENYASIQSDCNNWDWRIYEVKYE